MVLLFCENCNISPEGNSGGAFSCFMFCSLLSNVVLDGCSKGHTDQPLESFLKICLQEELNRIKELGL